MYGSSGDRGATTRLGGKNLGGEIMGPYCKFCGNRCFIPIPENTPKEILEAYKGKADIIATCPEGQKFEKKKIGYCYDDIKNQIAKKTKDKIYYADLIKEIQECLENMDGANLEELVNDHFDLGYEVKYIGDGYYEKVR